MSGFGTPPMTNKPATPSNTPERIREAEAWMGRQMQSDLEDMVVEIRRSLMRDGTKLLDAVQRIQAALEDAV